jgi:hypothetical protein
MLNRIRTESEILASKVDHFADKNDQQFLQSFDFEDPCQEIGGNQESNILKFS